MLVAEVNCSFEGNTECVRCACVPLRMCVCVVLVCVREFSVVPLRTTSIPGMVTALQPL